SDGTLGLCRVKECGGVALVQAPEEAEYGDMPRSAVATGVADTVLPAAQIGPRLVALWNNLQRLEMPRPTAAHVQLDPPSGLASAEQAEQALADVMRLVRTRTGHDFKHYKRATVLRRIERRLQVTAVPNLPAYSEFLDKHPGETQALLQDLLISVTHFFRDPAAFEALEHEIAASLPVEASAHPRLRAWVVGCATGEEAFSVAMLLAEHAASLHTKVDVQVFASDIDEQAIARARAGLYLDNVASDLAPERLNRYFVKEQGRLRVHKELRESVLFAAHNVLRDPPFSNLDLICCRNLLIYLDREMQIQALNMFHFALKPGGLLFLGMSESADSVPELFITVDKKHRIYRADGIRRAVRSRSLDVTSALRIALPSTLIPKPVFVALPAVPAPVLDAIGMLHQQLAASQAPGSVLIDDVYNVLHCTDQASAFLKFAAGEPSRNLLDVVRPELRVELRAAIFRAVQERASVVARRVHMMSDGRAGWVGMSVRPVESDGRWLLLVQFDQADVTFGLEALSGAEKDPMLVQLEDELGRLRDQLNGTVTDAAASHEELRASNEELQAINEELRSATEELETGKEEVQSVNEELITVNQELKSTLDETSKVNDDLSNLITSTDIATVFVDRALCIKRFTPRAAQLFNLIASDVGRPLLHIRHRLDYDELKADAQAAFDTLRVIEREVRDADGGAWLVRMLPYRTQQDVIGGAVLTFIDVTAIRAAQRQVKVGEANLQRVVETTQDYAIVTLDEHGAVIGWNPGAVLLYGYTSDEAAGRPFEFLFTPQDRTDGVPLRVLDAARESGRAEDERWHVAKNGSHRYTSGIVTPLHDHGQWIGYASIARDLTEGKRIEAQLEASLAKQQSTTAELARAFALKEEFLAVMSHELKHPLNLILVNAELLLRLPQARDVPAVAQAATVIRRTVLGQAKIIDDLLDLSRLRTGKLSLNQARIDGAEVIERVCQAIAADAASQRLSLNWQLEPAASAMEADPVRLEQIVWNLLSNAIKFTPPGGTVDVRLTGDGEFSRLDVQDSGQGISPDFLEQVFDMFQQAERVASRTQGGMGIGLALVRQLALAHGGRVEVASGGSGKGALFSVWLPRATAGAAPATWPLPQSVLLELRVLVVDDASDTREAFSMLLELEGAVVTAVADGAEALAALATEPFDLLLSDVAMPGIDGYQLIRTLRASGESNAAIAAVALTGFGRDQDTQRASDAGFDAHLPKPVSIDRLFEVVERVLATRKRVQ
ncbi:MAG: CheR family methyltransferase, partial [Burkholderiales bacterium]